MRYQAALRSDRGPPSYQCLASLATRRLHSAPQHPTISPMPGFDSGFAPRVKAVLGPTNTGKTHLAIERMLAHASGIIGFPLRLLARENYDRMVAQKGARYVALITGEEKIVPPDARWFSCTVEAMPLDRDAEFLAVDEIQLCADPDRGHVFTDRLLHARGMVETMFLGAETIRPLLQRLVPQASVETRPRLSQLSHVGPGQAGAPAAALRRGRVQRRRGLRHRRADPPPPGRLRGGDGPAQPAHAQRPGGAVPGQGGRFPGRHRRDRHGPQHGRRPRGVRRDGQVRRPPPAPADRGRGGADRRPRRPRHARRHVRHHRASARRWPTRWSPRSRRTASTPLDQLCWRNSDLDFTHVDALLASLTAPPPGPGLVKGNDAADLETLAALARDPDIRRLAHGRRMVRRLWEACQIPDFRKLADDTHTKLCARVFGHIAQRRAPADRLARRPDRRAGPRRGRYRHADAAARRRAGLVLYRRPRRLGAGQRRTGRAGRARSRTCCRTRCTSG